jgi:hypothetical protein
MTGDEFQTRYKLRKRIAAGAVRSYEAHDSGGREVLVHVLAGRATDMQSLLTLLDRLEPQQSQAVIETIEVEGTRVVITEALEEFESLPAWLKQKLHGKLREKSEEAAPEEPDEFAELFGGDDPGPQMEPGPPEEPEEEEPGEFTRLFGSAVESDAPLQPPHTTEPPHGKPFIRWREPSTEDTLSKRPSVRWKKPAGESRPPPPEPPRPATPKPPGPGEFTKLFNPEADSVPGPAEPASADPALPGSGRPTDRETRDYLRALSSSPSVPDGALPPPPVPGQAAPPPIAPASAVPAATPLPPTAGGPSEFSLVTSGETQRSDSGGHASDPSAGGASGAPRARTLVIGLSLIAAAVITIIIVFLIWG